MPDIEFDDSKIEIENVVLEYFLVFSRFEYALKRGDFAGSDRHGNARVDWNKWNNFVNEEKQEQKFEEKMGSDKDLKMAVDYLQTHPPKALKLGNSQLKWEDDNTGQEGLLRRLTTLTKRVRNSLFHGEKTDVIVPISSGRQLDLIKYSLKIVYTFVNLFLDKEHFRFMNM